MKRTLRVATVDDHPLVLEGIRQILRQAGHEIVGDAQRGVPLAKWLEMQRADALTVDIGMPGLNGIELARQVRAELPHLAIIVVTQQTDKAYLRAALKAGAQGFVSKQSAGTELVAALAAVAKGGVYVSPQLLQTAAGEPVSLKKLLRNGEEVLSERQQAVLRLLAEGKAMKEIALAMQISVKTVEFHKKALTEMLGISTTAELTKYAIAHGHAFLPG